MQTTSMKENSEEIAIELSKTKLVFALLVSIIFVILSSWFIINPQKFVNPIFRSKEIIFIAGILGVAVFGFFAIMITKKLPDKNKGLIISESGIFDNSSASSVGQIDWNDIIGISKSQVMSTKFLMILVHNPEKYIEKAKSRIAKKNMEANLKWYGSPIAISSNALKIDFNNLEKLLTENFEKYGEQKNVV